MRPSRDLFVSMLFFAALIGLAVFFGTRQKSEERNLGEARLYSTHSALDSGTVALALWLESMGYRTLRIEGKSFNLPREARVLFTFPNAYGPSGIAFVDDDIQAITTFVERGNTLIVAAESGLGSTRLGKALQADTRRLSAFADTSTIGQPLRGDVVPREAAIETALGLALERHNYVEYLRAPDLPVLVSFAYGRGRVWLTSAPRLFVNVNLRKEANAALVGALVSDAPYGSLVAFDEFHLGQSIPLNSGDTAGLLWNTPAGWAFLYALLVVFAFLLLNGQRLGRAVPVAQALVRRRPAEYIVAMAHLFRRAHKREMVLGHYHAGLKRRLAKPYGISPDLPDEEFVATLAGPAHVDTAALLQILHALSQKRIGEQELVRLVHRAVQFREQQG